MRLNDFLHEHAKFPFPRPDLGQSVSTSDISEVDVGLLEKEWKAERALRGDTLAGKLCQTLQEILDGSLLTAEHKSLLLAYFSPKLGHCINGSEDSFWSKNTSEADSRSFLDGGFMLAVNQCAQMHEGCTFRLSRKSRAEESKSTVDYVALVNDKSEALIEVTSPLVMRKLGEMLPPHGIELEWAASQSLVQKILGKAALYLGLRKMEWLFLTCHNFWIICRLMKDDDHTYLAYSPKFSIENSSVPFRAFLGAILSNGIGITVEPSAFDSDTELDTIVEEDKDHIPSPEPDNDHSGLYEDNSSKTTNSQATRSSPRTKQAQKADLLVTSSSPNSPESFQIWVHLHSIVNDLNLLPQCASTSNQQLWLTRFIGSGSTGSVWQCRFNNSNDLFAVKVVELLRTSDTDSRLRLRNELNIYLALDKAYQSGQLRNRIAPCCYGSFTCPRMDVLILDLCDGVWMTGESSTLLKGKSQFYQLVVDLHRIGIEHRDLEPRNIARQRGSGLCLIDFSQSARHVCKESDVTEGGSQTASAKNAPCPELQELRRCLGKRKSYQANT